MAFKGTKEKFTYANFFLSKRSVSLLPAVITLFVYLPALQNDFVNWDDNLYVYENVNIWSIDSHFFSWLLTAIVPANWHPLTMLSLAVDYTAWGLNPFGYHLTNILFHTLNTFLVFVLVSRLIGYELTQNSKLKTQNFQLLAASITALLFGIHPLHVESVAWISERKDVLYAFFYLLSVLAYVNYAASNKFKSYLFSLAFFILSLISKPMAVSLPIVLLILDYYPLEQVRQKGIKRVLLEKVPFFLLSIVSAAIAVSTQHSGGTLPSLSDYPLDARIFDAVRAFSFYLVKMLLPFNLAPHYPSSMKTDFFSIGFIGFLILPVVITIFCIRSLKKEKVFLYVWLYYIVSILPVLGIIKIGGHAMADRYTYMPSLGPFLLAGLVIAATYESSSKREFRIIIIISLLFLSCLFAGKTIMQVSIWRDSITLWSYGIKQTPYDYIPYRQRGEWYYKAGRYNEAVRDYDRAIRLNFSDSQVYFNRGIARHTVGDLQGALDDFNAAVRIDPEYGKAYTNCGIVYIDLGDYENAIRYFSKGIELNSRDMYAYNGRGNANYMIGNYNQAIEDYRTALRTNPNFTPASVGLENANRKLNGLR